MPVLARPMTTVERRLRDALAAVLVRAGVVAAVNPRLSTARLLELAERYAEPVALDYLSEPNPLLDAEIPF